LSKPPNEWTQFDIWNLSWVLKDYKFFKEKEDTLIELHRYLKRLSLRRGMLGEWVIWFGDIGWECFIILQGEVDIYLPRNMKLALTDLELVKLKI